MNEDPIFTSMQRNGLIKPPRTCFLSHLSLSLSTTPTYSAVITRAYPQPSTQDFPFAKTVTKMSITNPEHADWDEQDLNLLLSMLRSDTLADVAHPSFADMAEGFTGTRLTPPIDAASLERLVARLRDGTYPLPARWQVGPNGSFERV
ncbi:MAG: hypothetical protein M1824_002549 [Vezdaea acicularis]|nr:MAG: hypothetical protein M1824_002549 [Vezdaea acicularis]